MISEFSRLQVMILSNSQLRRASLTPESVTKETQQILEEVAKALNLEKLLPTYKFAVTVGCLRTIRKLQRYGQLPNKSDLFKSYAAYGQYYGVYCSQARFNEFTLFFQLFIICH